MKIISECLLHLTELNNDIGIERKQMLRRYLESYDEQQLIHMLSHQGVYANDIEIKFYPNVGFRTTNNNHMIVGKLPICNFIQRKLNEKYISYFKDA